MNPFDTLGNLLAFNQTLKPFEVGLYVPHIEAYKRRVLNPFRQHMNAKEGTETHLPYSRGTHDPSAASASQIQYSARRSLECMQGDTLEDAKEVHVFPVVAVHPPSG